MQAWLERPLPPYRIAGAGIVVVAGGAAYCFAYNSLQGEIENPLVGAAWSIANLLPWLGAFELAKRLSLPEPGLRRAAWPIAAVLAGTALLSFVLELAFGLIRPADAADLGFQLVRRLPGAGLVMVLLLIGAMWSVREARRNAPQEAPELPLLAHQIDWIKAAGNYVEIHGAAGLVLRRMTMGQAEARLAGAGFVRIHRSVLVNSARIAGVRRGKRADEVETASGEVLKVGTAYRASIAELERPRRA